MSIVCQADKDRSVGILIKMPPKSPRPRIKKMVLGSGYVVASNKHHAIYTPISICTGIVLHRPGKPGAVVGHRVTQSAKAMREFPTERDISRLLGGDVVNVTNRLHHPEDFLGFMLRAIKGRHGKSRLGIWEPSETKLTIIPGGMLNNVSEEYIRDISETAKKAKKHGIIGDYEVVRLKPGHIPEVRAMDGSVHQVPINIVPIKYITRYVNTDWEEEKP